jgi:hypothetical protein
MISERTGTTDRAVDEDALDILRLLQAVPTGELAAGMDRLLNHRLSAATTREAIDAVGELFRTRGSEGTMMAARAATPLEDADAIAASVVALATDLLA